MHNAVQFDSKRGFLLWLSSLLLEIEKFKNARSSENKVEPSTNNKDELYWTKGKWSEYLQQGDG